MIEEKFYNRVVLNCNMYYKPFNREFIEEEISITNFISKFKKYESNNVLIKTFTEGFCYYFSLILKSRFPEGKIFYNTMNHFVFKLDDRLFDITGDCTDIWTNKYLYDWEEFQRLEPLEVKGITRDCINKNNVYDII